MSSTDLDGLRIRRAVRALILDPDDRALLVRFKFPDGREMWAVPGGGVDDGESDEQALRRELREELGMEFEHLGPHVWTRTKLIPFINGKWDGQTDVVHLQRMPAFDPRPMFSWEQLNAEYVFDMRWWTAAELRESSEQFAPHRMPNLVTQVITHGPPTKPWIESD